MPNQIDPSSLAGLPPFQKLSKAQITEILALATVGRYENGAEIFTEGMPADRFFLLLDGHLRVVRLNEHGNQMIVRHIHAGQLFGIAKAIGQTTYPASAFTASDSIALAWPTRLWAGFIETYDGFGPAVYNSVGERLVEMNSVVMEMATYAVEQRVASAILRLARQSGRPAAEGLQIDFPVTRLNVSEMTGTTLHTASRLLAAWEKAGIVRSERRKIIVTDIDALIALSQPKDSARLA